MEQLRDDDRGIWSIVNPENTSRFFPRAHPVDVEMNIGYMPRGGTRHVDAIEEARIRLTKMSVIPDVEELESKVPMETFFETNGNAVFLGTEKSMKLPVLKPFP